LAVLLDQTNFDFSATDEIILYCQKGARSRQAVDHLSAKGFQGAVSLQGGVDLWQKISANI